MFRPLKFDSVNIIEAFSDSDFAGDRDTRKSRTGSLIAVNGGIVFWSSQQQKNVTLSSAEAEFVAASTTVSAIAWIKSLLRELDMSDMETILYMDNQPAMQLIKNPVHHLRTRHIDIKYKKVREMFDNDEFELEHIASENMLADILTKAMVTAPFRENARIIMHQIKGEC